MSGAKELTALLGGRWAGRYGTAPCPVCQPERRRDQRALVLADGRAGLLLDCKKSGCAFVDIVAAAGLRAGDYARPDPAEAARREAEARAETARKAERAARLWREAKPIEGTLAETYLRSRGITCTLPASLRFHPACWHQESARRWPAMVALVEGGEGFAIHRTWIRPDGLGKADVTPNKAMLGRTAGGAARLADGPGRLIAGEGIESTLSAFLLAGDATARAWAALSTSGLRALRLPAQPGPLMIATDGETAGREAARVLAERAHALDWVVTTADPGDGADFNDVLTGKAVLA